MAFEYENIPVQKVIVSNDWEDSERESVATQIGVLLDGIDLEEQQLRTTIKYEAPCFEELKGRKNSLLVLQAFVVSQTADFLETNRANFSDFLEDKNVLDGDYINLQESRLTSD